MAKPELVSIRDYEQGFLIPAWDADGMVAVDDGIQFEVATALSDYDGPSVPNEYDADALTLIQLPDGSLYYVLNIDLEYMGGA